MISASPLVAWRSHSCLLTLLWSSAQLQRLNKQTEDVKSWLGGWPCVIVHIDSRWLLIIKITYLDVWNKWHAATVRETQWVLFITQKYKTF